MDLELTVTGWGRLPPSQARARAESLSSSRKWGTSLGGTGSEGRGLEKMWAATVERCCLPGVKGYEQPGFGAMHTGMCVQRDVTEWHRCVVCVWCGVVYVACLCVCVCVI